MLRIITKAYSLYYYNLVLVINQIRGEWGGVGEKQFTGSPKMLCSPTQRSKFIVILGEQSGEAPVTEVVRFRVCIIFCRVRQRRYRRYRCALNFVNSYISYMSNPSSQ